MSAPSLCASRRLISQSTQNTCEVKRAGVCHSCICSVFVIGFNSVELSSVHPSSSHPSVSPHPSLSASVSVAPEGGVEVAEQGERRERGVRRGVSGELQEGVGVQIVLAGRMEVGQLGVVKRAREELLHGVVEKGERERGRGRRGRRGRRGEGRGGRGGGGGGQSHPHFPLPAAVVPRVRRQEGDGGGRRGGSDVCHLGVEAEHPVDDPRHGAAQLHLQRLGKLLAALLALVFYPPMPVAPHQPATIQPQPRSLHHSLQVSVCAQVGVELPSNPPGASTGLEEVVDEGESGGSEGWRKAPGAGLRMTSAEV
ncbi:hypothetical protein EYF80_055625 [Liparis tanakae]|uniref:Uncharacterized protein n=1 Tax=Liparis tanakae TaxID=230148 RepID=A0A4Z2EZU0_9TELE|nr:hypothetical protein EYF80_055625 [Liparis tanakae]